MLMLGLIRRMFDVSYRSIQQLGQADCHSSG
jgi:hypothetical protein